MSKSIAFLTFLIGIGFALPASGQNKAYAMQTGNDALAACTSVNDDQRTGDIMLGVACLSWINGAVQASDPRDWSFPEKPVYCTPQSGGSNGQYKDVFVAYLRNNPAKRHLPAIFLFHQAMAGAFPCSN